MTNILETKFVFIDADLNKVDQTRNSLFALNTDLNNLGKNTKLGQTIADNFDTAGKSADNFKNKINDSVSKPTVSRYWETEEQKTVTSLKNIETAIVKTKSVTGNPGADSLKRISGLSETVVPSNKINIAPDLADIDRIQKKAEAARDTLAQIANTRIGSGQMTNLTKELDSARARAVSLTGEIISIKKELANPNRKSSIKFLTDELNAAEREADKLNRKLNTLPSGASGSNNVRLSSFQKTNLSYQVNDVLTGLASGQNPTQILAQQGGQIAQIFSPAQAAALVATYGSLVTVLGAGAAALLLTYKITGDIRAEAEKRLKIETMISAAGNKQILGQQEAIKNLEKMRQLAAENRGFSQFLGQATINDLETRKKNLESLLPFTPNEINGKANERFQVLSSELQQIDAQIVALKQRNKLEVENTFNQRNESFKKSQESAIEYQRKSQQAAIEAEKKFQAEVEKGKNKVIELGKTYNSVLNDLSVRVNSQNPFVQVFAESRNELEKLKESLKGLPEEMRRAAIESQQAINKNKLFETRIDNNLSILDLKETADKFRNAGNTDAYKKLFEDAVRGDISRGNFFNGQFGSYGSFIANKVGGFDKLNDSQKRDIYEVNQLKSLSDFNNPNAGLNDRSLISRLARERVANPNENLSINERLQKQIKIINSGVSSEAERSIADKKLLAVGGTLDPAQIRSDLREQIAAAADRQAEEKANFERKNFELEQQKLKSQEKLTEALNKLTKLAEQGGLSKVELTINSDGTVDVSEENNPSRATNDDVGKTYGGYQNALN